MSYFDSKTEEELISMLNDSVRDERVVMRYTLRKGDEVYGVIGPGFLDRSSNILVRLKEADSRWIKRWMSREAVKSTLSYSWKLFAMSYGGALAGSLLSGNPNTMLNPVVLGFATGIPAFFGAMHYVALKKLGLIDMTPKIFLRKYGKDELRNLVDYFRSYNK